MSCGFSCCLVSVTLSAPAPLSDSANDPAHRFLHVRLRTLLLCVACGYPVAKNPRIAALIHCSRVTTRIVAGGRPLSPAALVQSAPRRQLG